MESFICQGETLELHPEKGLYWPKEETLFLADMHFGKIRHFRKAGIGLPNETIHDNMKRLCDLILKLKAKRVIFLGDLFHSDYNSEWEIFADTMALFPKVIFELIMGNHDIIGRELFESAGLICHDPVLKLGPFLLVHDHLDPRIKEMDGFRLCGHVHPGIRLAGKAKMRLRLPCFYFDKNYGILPAFGGFTGLANLKFSKRHDVFAIAEGRIIKI